MVIYNKMQGTRILEIQTLHIIAHEDPINS